MCVKIFCNLVKVYTPVVAKSLRGSFFSGHSLQRKLYTWIRQRHNKFTDQTRILTRINDSHHSRPNKWKSAQRDANTARPPQSPHRRTESAMAVVRQSQNFSHAADPLPAGAQDRQNLISWRWSLSAPTDPVWWRSMHPISSYRGNRHRPPATNTQTGPITKHCAAS